MYGNLLSAVSHLLTPNTIANMAEVAGIANSATATKVAAAAVPAILSALASLASKPEGAERLGAAVAEHARCALDSLVGGCCSASSAETGERALASLIGSGPLRSLTIVLGRSFGVADGAARAMVGMLTEMVLGVLGRETGPAGVEQVLAAQRDHIAAALPRPLAAALRSSGFFGGPRLVASPVSEAQPSYRAAPSGDPATHAGSAAPAGSIHWAYWALPLAAIAGLLWYLFGGEPGPPITVAPSGVGAPPSPQAALPGEDLRQRVSSVIDALHGSLQRARNATSAADALPQLRQVDNELDRLHGMVGRLPPEARQQLAVAVTVGRARLQPAVEAIDALPGAPADVKAAIAATSAKLDELLPPGAPAVQRSPPANGSVADVAMPPKEATSARAYLDQFVYNSAGDKIGVVNDLVLAADGRVDAAVIGVGGFLGMGEKNVALAFSAIRLAHLGDGSRLVVDTTKDRLRDAPSYRGGAPRN